MNVYNIPPFLPPSPIAAAAHNEQFSQIASCRNIPSKLSPLVAGSLCFASLATSRHHLSPVAAGGGGGGGDDYTTTTTGGYAARSISAVARYHNILLLAHQLTRRCEIC